MKKLLCMLLALAMLCAFAVAETADVTGMWYLNEVQTQAMSLNPAMLGMEMTISLSEDGTAAVTSTGSSDDAAEGTWEMSGDTVTVTVEGAPLEMKLDESGNLVAIEAETGTTLVFGREKQEPEYYDPGTERTDVTLADFDGTWTATVMRMGDMELAVADMGAEMLIELSGGNGTVTEVSAGADEPRVYEVTGELTDGALTLTQTETEDSPAAMTLKLYDSGVLVYSEGELGVIYFERITVTEDAA